MESEEDVEGQSRRLNLSPPVKAAKQQPNSVGVLRQDAVNQLPSQVPLDDPLGTVPRNMSSLSIQPASPETFNSRKRRAGSNTSRADPPTRAGSPFKVSRQSSSNLQTSPDSPAQFQSPSLTPRHRNPTGHNADPARQYPRPQIPTGPVQSTAPRHDEGIERKRAQARPRRSPMSVHFPRAQLIGKDKSANDAIAELKRIHSITDFPPDFSLLGDGDESREEDDEVEDLPVHTSMVNQPESRPISQQQLATEVKGIYSGLVLVEGKCVDIVSQEAQSAPPPASGKQHAAGKHHGLAGKSQVDQFPALIALHRTLLHEHHDFFLASQHPSAGNGIKELATKYSMPARMWKHGIHNFLELLRHNLPESLDYMLAFIYLAYQMMALLFETVPTFEDTWIECLGDLARYRMAIEDEDIRDREVWTSVARFWYMRAADKNCQIGRLLHHLGILARSNPLSQLSLYCRSLTADQPFDSSRESIVTLFDPALARLNKANPARPLSNDMYFVLVHACMFGMKVTHDLLDRAWSTYTSGLNAQIAQLGTRWRESGAFVASANIAALLKYGCTDSTIRSILVPKERPSDRPACLSPTRDKGSADPDDFVEAGSTESSLSNEWKFTLQCFNTTLQRKSDPNVLPMVTVMLVFLWALSATPQGSAYLNDLIPWDLIAQFVNSLSGFLDQATFVSMLHYATLHEKDASPLPEDYHLRGQVYTNGLFPPHWFSRAPVDVDERFIENDDSYNVRRAYRVKWLAARIAFSHTHARSSTSESALTDVPGAPMSSTNILEGNSSEHQRRCLHYDSKTDLFTVASGTTVGSAASTRSASDPMDGVAAT